MKTQNLYFKKRSSKRRKHSSKISSKNEIEIKNAPNLSIFNQQAQYRFSSVIFIEKESEFFCVFENGDSYHLARKLLKFDHPKLKIKKVTLPKYRGHFNVLLESGEKFEVPWSYVRHQCDPNYEYYKYNQTSIEAEKESKQLDQIIGKKIKNIRKQQGMTQEQLAKKTKIKRSNISRLESSKHSPNIETLEKIATALNVPVADLI